MKVIAIAGASASGKTYIAEALYDYLQQQYGVDSVESLSEDSYYRHTPDLSIEQRAQINFDHPDAFEHALLVQHLKQLQKGDSIEKPQYCYKTHLRLPQTEIKKPAKWLILEGMHLFHRQKIADMFDYKIYVETPIEVCLKRRIARDQKQRKRTLESILNQFETTVKPMYVKYIKPTKKMANIVVNGEKSSEENVEEIAKKLK